MSATGSGEAMGVWMSEESGRTINDATIVDPTISGATQSGGEATGLTLLTTTTASTVGFYGVTATAQPANAAQAALTLTTATTPGYGFVTSTAFTAFIAQLENIRASLVLLGLLKGSA